MWLKLKQAPIFQPQIWLHGSIRFEAIPADSLPQSLETGTWRIPFSLFADSDPISPEHEGIGIVWGRLPQTWFKFVAEDFRRHVVMLEELRCL